MKRILVVGGGSIGERHVRCFLRTRRAEVSLCEINEEVRRRVASEYQLSEVYQSLTAALRASFDAAVICTPANWHIEMALALAEKNISLLIEKPLSTSMDNVDRLKSKLEERKLAVSVAYVTRHHPALRQMKSAIQTERFGRPVQISYVGGQHFPFYRPAYRDIYYSDHASGGGAIQDAITHTMNAAEWLVGPVTRLVTDADHCVLDGVTVEDTVHMLTRHGSVLGAFSLNQHQPVNESTLTVSCENGAVRFESHHSRWLTAREPDQPWTVEAQFDLQRDDLFVLQANSFLDQVEGTCPPACSIAEGIQTLRVNMAALDSWRNRQWIDLIDS